MSLVSKSEFLFAVLAGGVFGIVVTVALSLIYGGGVVDALLVLSGAYIGFSLVCAAFMIKNASPRRGSH